MQLPAHPDQIQDEIRRRRTFAIISHPDAGKTTLTEKLLLYANAIEQAGAVRAHRNQRHAVSDWMAMEQERGISITSTVLQFEYEQHLFNLLDTPGHQDFSEDTYRTLTAVDSAVMVLDSAKGIEPQTQKLFAVCRQQQVPILTFINKMDRPGRDPFELLDEIEHVLNIHATPMNWPIGSGGDFQGVYDIVNSRVLLFQRTTRGKFRAPVKVAGLEDDTLVELIGEAACSTLRDEIELLAGAGIPFSRSAFLQGELTPVYFGSALNNFGVEPFLQAVIDIAPPPRARTSSHGEIEPDSETFSGFIFKIQANMDPKHRDRMAFLRVCSGRFERDMTVHHSRQERQIRLSRPHRLFAQGRETVEFAYPGDIVGLSNPGLFTIGDTVSSASQIHFDTIPPFQPEIFALLQNQSMDKYKQFNKGIEQLREEGVVQILYPVDTGRREPILAAVGDLQFDVVVARLAAEYGVESTVKRLNHTIACWISGSDQAINSVYWPLESRRTLDHQNRLVILFESLWQLKHIIKNQPDLQFKNIAGQPFLTTSDV